MNLLTEVGVQMDDNSKVIFCYTQKYKINKKYKKKINNLIFVFIGLVLFVLSVQAEEKGEDGKKIIREGPPPLKNPQYLNLGTFVVNMPGHKYFLKSSIHLAFENSAAKEWLLARIPIAKDLVIAHLNSITVEQFDEPKNRAVIKNDLQTRLNSLFPNKNPWDDYNPIRRILFLEFYRQ